MSLVQLENIAIHFPERTLFEGLSWQILPRERYGLVGPNGAGKTTILRLIAGEIEPSEGTLWRLKHLACGYLPQETTSDEQRPLFNAVFSALPDIPALAAELEKLRHEMAADNSPDELLERYGVLESRWMAMEGYSAESRVARVLHGLGFRQDDYERPVSTFSGGWRMRVHLAKLLLQSPDILLLDEPTNHLDLPTLAWLEEYLEVFRGALVIVSHDRAFLDRMVTSTVEIDRGQFRKYAGNYSEFERERERRQEKLEAHAARLATERQRIERFVERFRYKASKARQVQSRVRFLSKLEKVQEETETRHIRFHFPDAPHSGRIVLEVKRLSKQYGDKTVLKDIDVVLERGQKVALVGVNGAGKSTLCRLIAGLEPPTSGELRLGHEVRLDYFAQEADFHLQGGRSVLEELSAEASVSELPNLRRMLGVFLFRGDDVLKSVDVLSGGEKSRLAIAKILLHPSNFLILDEPTNHLDIPSKDVLLSALREYGGTLLMVSHDRYFLERLVDRVLELENGRLKEWPGNFGEYLERKALFQKTEKESEPKSPSRDSGEVVGHKTREQRRSEAERRNQFSQRRQFLQRRLDELSQSIERLESRKSELEGLLSVEETYHRGEGVREIIAAYEQIRKELPRLYEEWEYLEAQRETLENEMAS
jgi:ATP-binding cassette subfamily F protein 3